MRDAENFYFIRTKQVMFRTESKADSLWKKLWIAAKNRRLFAIRKMYVIDLEGVRRLSNSRFAIRNLRAGAAARRGSGSILVEVSLRVL
jgi:hypothetical protein